MEQLGKKVPAAKKHQDTIYEILKREVRRSHSPRLLKLGTDTPRHWAFHAHHELAGRSINAAAAPGLAGSPGAADRVAQRDGCALTEGALQMAVDESYVGMVRLGVLRIRQPL